MNSYDTDYFLFSMTAID